MASSIVKSAAQQLGTLAVEEAKYLYKVKRKIESLQMELEWIECFLKDADTQQHKDEVVCKWVSQVRDFAYDSEDIIERFVHEVSHHRRDDHIFNSLKWFSSILCSGDVMTLHDLGSELDFLTSRMAELTSRLQRYGVQVIRPTKSLEYNRMAREKCRTYSYSKEEVVGLDEDIKQVVNQLLRADINVVGISGTGGLGKTTLARKVVKHKDIKRHFHDNCVWVYVSKGFDTDSVFQEMLHGLGKDTDLKERKPEDEDGVEAKKLPRHRKQGESKNENKGPLKGEELVEEIRKRIQVQKCLIVLDDIWTAEAWERLKRVFESIGEGSLSKILLTTRYQGLVEYIDSNSGYLHTLKPLSSGDSWELLQKKAFKGRSFTGGDSATGNQENGQNEPQDMEQVKCEFKIDSEMEKVGMEMLAHCDGLPIAIVALGGILSTKNTLDEWKDVQKNISSYLISNVEQSKSSRVLEVLELSYHELPYYLKPCFLYLGHFPEDYKISAQTLYHLWGAEGLLVREGGAKKQGATTYDIGERYLSELVQRSMVEVEECWPNGRIKTCQVHDVMRDMCLTKCEEVGFLNYIQFTESDTDSMLPILSTAIKKLRRCAVHDQKGDVVDKHFEKGGEATSLRSMLMIKSEISAKIWKSFLLLRVLSLEGIDLGCMDGVGKLIHLRYLSVRDSELDWLPSDLNGLKYLETLDLRLKKENYFDLTLRNNEFDKLKKLRHLYLPRHCARSTSKDEMVSINGGGEMETLVNFDPSICEMKVLMQMPNLRIFSIIENYFFDDKNVLKGLLEAPVMKNSGQLINSFRLKIREDTLSDVNPELLSSLTRNPSFTDLLIIVDIKYNPRRVGESLKSKNHIFVGSLTRVDLYICEIREEDVLALEKLPHLIHLRLCGCLFATEFRYLIFSADSFPRLTQLFIEEITQVVKWNVGEGALPHLQNLEVFDCNHLQEWVLPEGALPNLQILSWRCRGDILKNISTNLKEVIIRHCEVECSFAALAKLPYLHQLHISFIIGDKIRFHPGSFPRLSQFEFKEASTMETMEFEDGAAPTLQRLVLGICWKLKVLMNLPNSLTSVGLLNCSFEHMEMECIILILEKLPRLQHLIIEDAVAPQCKKVSFSPGSFSQLTQLEIRYQGSLEELEVGEGALPNLQRLRLYRCVKLKELPSGLPDSVRIECENPCINGIENYNTCPHFKPEPEPASRFKLTNWRLR